MTRYLMNILTIALILCFFIGDLPTVNAAQEIGAEFTLEEITVTAEKRTENLQKVAMSVEVVKGEDLLNQGAVTINDVLKNIPNVSTTDSGGSDGYTVNIRGLGNDMQIGTGETSVSINIDGAYQVHNEVGGMFGYFDVDQVEVLRGPQGTLYGRNAIGGTINITSKKPSTEGIEGYISIEVAEFKKLKQEAAINLPITDKFAGRLALVNAKQSAFTYDKNGYRDSQNGLGTRLQLLYVPGNDVSINFIYSYTQRSGGLWGEVLKSNYDEGKYYLNENEYPYDTTEKIDDYHTTFSITAEIPMGPGIVTVIPTYQKDKGRSFNYGINPTDSSGAVTFTAGLDPWKDETEIVDLRYASKSDSRVKWTTGLYWTKSDSPQYPTDAQPDGDRWSNSKAALGQVTYPFTDTFRGIVGARYTEDNKGFDRMIWGRGNIVEIDSDSFSFSYFDWKLGIEKDLGQDMMTYFTLASGHKSGGYSQDNGEPFDVESAISGEFGLKSRLLDSHLQLNGDVFYYRYSGYQVVDAYLWTNPDTGISEFVTHDYNAPKVQNLGAEIDATAILGNATGLDFSLSWLKNKYVDDFWMHPVEDGPAVNYKGETLPHSPEFTFRVGLVHTFYLSDGSTLTPNVSYRWTDEQYYSVLPQEGSLGPAVDVCDFTMAYTAVKGWYLNFYANNALNKHYYSSMRVAESDTKLYMSSPRVMGVILNIKF